MSLLRYDTVNKRGVRTAGRRCKDCDRDIYDEDTACKWCGSTNIVMPYPPATTLTQAVANVFEHDEKRARIVDGIVKSTWPEEEGAQTLAGMIAFELEGEDPGHEACLAAVHLGLSQKRAS